MCIWDIRWARLLWYHQMRQRFVATQRPQPRCLFWQFAKIIRWQLVVAVTMARCATILAIHPFQMECLTRNNISQCHRRHWVLIIHRQDPFYKACVQVLRVSCVANWLSDQTEKPQHLCLFGQLHLRAKRQHSTWIANHCQSTKHKERRCEWLSTMQLNCIGAFCWWCCVEAHTLTFRVGCESKGQL